MKILNNLFPNEIYHIIFEYLNYKDIVNIEKTCSHFNRLTHKEEFWRNLAIRNYPRLNIIKEGILNYKKAIGDLEKEEKTTQKGNLNFYGIFIDFRNNEIEDSMFLFDLNLVNTSENKIEGYILWELFHTDNKNYKIQIGQRGVEKVAGKINENRFQFKGESLLHYYLIALDSYDFKLNGLTVRGNSEGNHKDWKCCIYLTSKKFINNPYEYLINYYELDKVYKNFQFFKENRKIEKKTKSRIRFKLNDSAFLNIMNYCEFFDLITLSKTCSHLYNLVNNNDEVWKRTAINYYPERIKKLKYKKAIDWIQCINDFNQELSNQVFRQFYFKGLLFSKKDSKLNIFEVDLFLINTNPQHERDYQGVLKYVYIPQKDEKIECDFTGIVYISGSLKLEEGLIFLMETERIIKNKECLKSDNYVFEVNGFDAIGSSRDEKYEIFLICPRSVSDVKKEIIDHFELDKKFKDIIKYF